MNSNKLLPLLTILLLAVSSNVKAQDTQLISSLKKVDCIEIRFLKSPTTLTYQSRRKEHLTFFTDLLINAKNHTTSKCDSTTEILYLNKKNIVQRAYFSSHITGSKYADAAVAFNVNKVVIKSPANYNVGMIIDEVYHKSTNEKSKK